MIKKFLITLLLLLPTVPAVAGYDVVGNLGVSGQSILTGNVGVGTTIPRAKLDVSGEIYGGTLTTETVYLTGIGDSYFMGGNIGIGTTQPRGKLDVDGNIYLNGSVHGEEMALSGTNPSIFTGNYVSIGTEENRGIANGAGDLYVQKDLEVDNSTYISQRLYVGSPSISWAGMDGSVGEASFSDNVEIDGALYVDGFLYGNGSKLTGIIGGTGTTISGLTANNVSKANSTGNNFIDSSIYDVNGNIGIGTTVPINSLEAVGGIASILGSNNTKATFKALSPGANFPRASFIIGRTSSDTNVGMTIAPDKDGISSFIEASTYEDATNGSSKQIIIYSAPTFGMIATLTADSTSGAPLMFSTQDYDDFNKAAIYVSNASGQNVGINTSTPSATMDIGGGSRTSLMDGIDDMLVKGDVEVDGALYADGFIYGNGSQLTGITAVATVTATAPLYATAGNVTLDTTGLGGSGTVISGLTANSVSKANVTGDNLVDSAIYDVNGYVGIGTITPSSELDIGGGTRGLMDGIDDLLVKGDIEADNNLYARKAFFGVATISYCPGNLSTCAFEVASNDPLQSDFVFRLATASAGNAAIVLGRSRGTTDSPGNISSGDLLGGVYGYGYGGGVWNTAGSINFVSDAASGATDMPGRIVFNTTPDGSATMSERMRITNVGCVGIGTTDPVGTLDVRRVLNVRVNATNSGNIGIGTWNPTTMLQVGKAAVRTRANPDDVSIQGNVEVDNRIYVDTQLYVGNPVISWVGMDGSVGEASFSNDVEIDGSLYVDGFLYGNGSKLTGITATATVTADAPLYVTAGNITLDTTGLGGGGVTGVNAGYIPVAASTTTLTDSVIYQNGQNVGIGTITPTAALEVSGVATLDKFMVSSTLPTHGDYLIVKSTGNVGIGTINPRQKLDVAGSIAVIGGNIGVGTVASTKLQIGITNLVSSTPAQAFFGEYSSTTGWPIFIGNWNSTGIWAFGPDSGSSTSNTIRAGVTNNFNTAWTADQSAIKLVVGGVGSMWGTYVGQNVGIGTSITSAALEVSRGNTMDLFMISSASTTNGDYIIVTSAGNVGIGSTSPQRKLVIGGVGSRLGMIASDGSIYNCGPSTVGAWECL
jgi:hypothetical protein